MPVYVDKMEAKFGNMVMCHMIADHHFELMAMANLIGVQHKWIQHPGTPKEHFDICLSKRELAIRNGAVELNRDAFVKKMKEKLASIRAP